MNKAILSLGKTDVKVLWAQMFPELLLLSQQPGGGWSCLWPPADMLLPPRHPPRVSTRPVVLGFAERSRGCCRDLDHFLQPLLQSCRQSKQMGSPKVTGVQEGNAEGSKMMPIKQGKSLT